MNYLIKISKVRCDMVFIMPLIRCCPGVVPKRESQVEAEPDEAGGRYGGAGHGGRASRLPQRPDPAHFPGHLLTLPRYTNQPSVQSRLPLDR